jgi:hypothetical protein
MCHDNSENNQGRTISPLPAKRSGLTRIKSAGEYRDDHECVSMRSPIWRSRTVAQIMAQVRQ